MTENITYPHTRVVKIALIYVVLTKQCMKKVVPVSKDFVPNGFGGDTLGRAGRAPSLGTTFIFVQFLAKILPNNKFCPKLRGWCPHLGNLESATANLLKSDKRMKFKKFICGRNVNLIDIC